VNMQVPALSPHPNVGVSRSREDFCRA
jgi:hypothetical protein